MEANKLKRKNIVQLSPAHGYDDDDYTSDDDINYNCERDSSGDEYNEEEEEEEEEATTGNNKSKRLKSCSSNDDLFRNRTPSNNTKASIKRNPTRKPNPKISNRNALMARENRRKKKEHLETLQKNVEETQSENKKLKKMLRTRNNAITKLTQESLYLRSILANKTEIMSLLKTIQGNRTPITSSTLSFVTGNSLQQCNDITSNGRITSYANSSGCSPTSSMSSGSFCCDGEDDKENDLDLDCAGNDRIDISPTQLTSSFDQNNGDFQWENLLSDCSTYKADFNPLNIADLRDIDDSEILSTNSSSNVTIEHNYFNNPITNKVAEKGDNAPGICLHVSSGRVSLEFCASCHLNSQNAWCEEM